MLIKEYSSMFPLLPEYRIDAMVGGHIKGEKWKILF